MNYYNPYNSEIEQERNLTILFKEALIKAYEIDSIDFNYYDMIVIFHAGIGQDFSLPFLDPTPEDIPSTYIDNNMIGSYLGTEALIINGNEIHKGIILPETQNHLLYDISLDMFNTSEPCDYQYGLTGTFALMVGFFIGLPPLWNINTGESGVGIFGLMDHDLIMVEVWYLPTNRMDKILAGWDDSEDISLNTCATLYDNMPNQIGKLTSMNQV